MSSTADTRQDQRVARASGLKLPAYRRLRDALAEGESLAWLRMADPACAGLFPNPLGFELLVDRLQTEQALERRRANLLRALEGKELPEVEGAVAEAADEGELEDLALALEPSPAPANWEKPEREEHAAFFEKLRGDAFLARELRRLFRKKALVTVAVADGKENESKAYQEFLGSPHPLPDMAPARYLAIRRGEHAHVLHLEFELPTGELRTLFDQSVKDVPVQEKDAYLKLFLKFVEEERIGRLVQETRARLKRSAESYTLQRAWDHLESSLDRGRHDGRVLGFFALRNHKVYAALLDPHGDLMRCTQLHGQAEDFAQKLQRFVGEDAVSLVAVQADSATRSASTKVQGALELEKHKIRTALVPLAVVKTMLREVARRPGETHLSHDERQAVLLGRLASDPRAAAFHTPHIVRAYIPYRSEINARRLEAFELCFLRSLLASRGVDLNHGSHDMLRLVPGIDPDAIEIERSTAPFRSLEDMQARMGLPEADWRAACCFLRVRDGDQPLDARPIHPFYYPVLLQLLEDSELTVPDLLREPARVAELDWQPVLEERGWSEAVVDLLKRSLGKGSRRPRRAPGRGQRGQRLESLEIGATLKGKVSSLVPYGAFVDVGARREGLVHVSAMSDRFVKDPSEVVQEGQEVTVWVVSIDVEKQRFRLSMVDPAVMEEQKAAAGPRRSGGPGGGRQTRPKSTRPGGRRREGGDRGRRRRDEVETGPDPRAGKKEEFDPTNPFYQFFKDRDLGGGAAKGSDAKDSGGAEEGTGSGG